MTVLETKVRMRGKDVRKYAYCAPVKRKEKRRKAHVFRLCGNATKKSE